MGSSKGISKMFKPIIICIGLVLAFNLTEGRKLRRYKRTLRQADSLTCRDGSKRMCTCSDGSQANLTNNPCPPGSRPDINNGCLCPLGYNETPIPGRTHGLHHLCTDKDKTQADWSKHPCKEGHVKKCQCQK